MHIVVVKQRQDHLGPVGRGIVMLDLKLLAHFCHHLIIQVGAVVRDNLPWQTISADDLFLMNLTTTPLVTLV